MMGLLALIVGTLGGLCALMGVLTATKVVPIFFTHFTPIFWLGLGGVLFVAVIAALVARSGYE